MKVIPNAFLASLPESSPRRGGFLILALFCLIGCLVFVAFSVDLGFLNLQKSQMQNAVDAAALAAAQEISAAVRSAPPETENVTAYAIDSARQVAADVAELNGVYVDPAVDVRFGLRTYNSSTGGYDITWNVTPANVVEVTARRTRDDVSAPDGKLQLFFAGIGGDRFAQVQTQATAVIEARDLVVVHDFSRSMNFDSQFSNESVSRLSDTQIVQNLESVWADLNLSLGNLEFTPRYLTLSRTDEGITSSVEFRYDDAVVTTSGTLQEVRVRYSNGREDTFSVSGSSATIDGSRDITRVTVTSQSEGGSEPETQSSGGFTVTFSSDRKTAEISSNRRLDSLQVRFESGGSDSQSWSRGPRSYTYSSSREIDWIRVSNSRGSTEQFDASPSNGAQTVVQQFDDTDDNVKEAFGLDDVPYPFPRGSWDEFIDHCRNYSELSSRNYRETYGGLTFANYLVRERSSHTETPALCRTRHYPFHAIKEGHSLLCSFLEDLGFDDHLGMVSYDTNHRVETQLNEVGLPYVDVSRTPLSNDYAAINNLMRFKQANHYSPSTNMGGGLVDALDLLDRHKRAGARPTIILMTDGNTNVMDHGENGNLPSGWDWNEMLDMDGDGSYDYYTSSSQKRYVLRLASEAAAKGYTLHTMSVGMDADRDLMQAVAHIGGGVYLDIPGGYSVLDMEEEVKEGFYKIASHVPPPRLVANDQGP